MVLPLTELGRASSVECQGGEGGVAAVAGGAPHPQIVALLSKVQMATFSCLALRLTYWNNIVI